MSVDFDAKLGKKISVELYMKLGINFSNILRD